MREADPIRTLRQQPRGSQPRGNDVRHAFPIHQTIEVPFRKAERDSIAQPAGQVREEPNAVSRGIAHAFPHERVEEGVAAAPFPELLAHLGEEPRLQASRNSAEEPFQFSG